MIPSDQEELKIEPLMSNEQEFKIEPLMSDEQKFIEKYNDTLLIQSQKIPLIPRNMHTGWPLLQISLFFKKGNHYIPHVAGGKCHSIDFAYYFSAQLLRKINFGEIETNLTDHHFEIMNPNNFNNEYYLKIKAPLITIEAKSNAYGILSTINIGGSELNNVLRDINRITTQNKINLFGHHNETYFNYTSQEILNSLNKDLAIFYEGQIFVDFGTLLKLANVEDDVIDTFQGLFQVDLFNDALSTLSLEQVMHIKENIVKNQQKSSKPLPTPPKKESNLDLLDHEKQLNTKNIKLEPSLSLLDYIKNNQKKLIAGALLGASAGIAITIMKFSLFVALTLISMTINPILLLGIGIAIFIITGALLGSLTVAGIDKLTESCQPCNSIFTVDQKQVTALHNLSANKDTLIDQDNINETDPVYSPAGINYIQQAQVAKNNTLTNNNNVNTDTTSQNNTTHSVFSLNY